MTELSSQLMGAIPLAVFLVIGTIAVASSILVVVMRNPVHSALFLLVTFLCVAVLFIMMGAEFVGAVQILVYAGGIMVLFLFVVMLINVRHLPDEKMYSPYWKGGVAIGLGLLLFMAMIVRGGDYAPVVNEPTNLHSVSTYKIRKSTNADGKVVRKKIRSRKVVGNSEAVGDLLYTEYLVPFEVASLFLLVAMVGAILIGKRQLDREEEEQTPAFILERSAEEKQVKESMGA